MESRSSRGAGTPTQTAQTQAYGRICYPIVSLPGLPERCTEDEQEPKKRLIRTSRALQQGATRIRGLVKREQPPSDRVPYLVRGINLHRVLVFLWPDDGNGSVSHMQVNQQANRKKETRCRCALCHHQIGKQDFLRMYASILPSSSLSFSCSADRETGAANVRQALLVWSDT